MRKALLLLLALALPLSSFASSTRTLYGDQIKNAAQSVTNTMPSASGTLLNTVSTNVPVAASLTQVFPSGACNGSNTTLTLPQTPGGSSSVGLYIDGIMQSQGTGNDYSISGATITLRTACATGQIAYAVYSLY
jgi:hypothetical protein